MELDVKINAADILHYLKRIDWNSSFDFSVTEFCPYHESRRIDLFYYSRWNRQTKGYEIKIHRSDFLQDKKWQDYLKFCTWFSFIAPKGIIQKEELPPNIGLVEIDIHKSNEEYYDEHDLRESAKFYTLTHQIIKRPRKINETIADQEYIRLLEGLIMKLAYEKNIL
jgi:hypothetical protein